MPAGIPVCRGGGLGDRADHLVRPDQPGHLHVADDLGHPLVDPVERAHVVERVALAGRVVIEDVLPGQLGRDVGIGAVPTVSAGPGVRLVAPEPQDLGPDRLRAEGLAAALQDGLGAEPVGQLVDLRRRPAVDAVEDGRPDRFEVLVAHQQAGPDPAHAHPGDPAARRRGPSTPGRPRRSRPTRPWWRRPRPSRGAAATSCASGLAVATISPSGVASTPLVLPVPMSMPSSSSLTGPLCLLPIVWCRTGGRHPATAAPAAARATIQSSIAASRSSTRTVVCSGARLSNIR